MTGEKWRDIDYVQWVFDTGPMINFFNAPKTVENLIVSLRDLRELSGGDPTAKQMFDAWKSAANAIGGMMMARLLKDESLGELVHGFPAKHKDIAGERTLFSDGSMRVMLVASPDGSRADVVMREV